MYDQKVIRAQIQQPGAGILGDGLTAYNQKSTSIESKMK